MVLLGKIVVGGVEGQVACHASWIRL